MAGISSKAAGTIQNKEKTFQGQRFDDDLGLNWVQFKWRNHDPQIGRFIEVDPLSDKYVYNSTYAFSENKVTRHVELEGLEAVLPNPTGNPVISVCNIFAGWGQDLKQGLETYKNSRVEQANLQAGNYDNQPAPAQDFHKLNAALGETAGVMQMDKPALEFVSTAASMMVGVEVPASAPLVTGSSFGLKGSVSLTGNVVKLGEVKALESAPNFIVDGGGQAFPVPVGAKGPISAANGKGVQYVGGAGGENGQVTTMRIMDAVPAKGNAPAYPNGYVKYENAHGQGVNPYSGKTTSKSESHLPIWLFQ